MAGAASHGSATELRSPARQSSPATRAMRLTKTSPQPALPDEAEPGDWGSGYNGHGGAQGGDGPDAATRGGRHSHRARRQRYDDDDEDFPQHHDGRRRWPIVTTLLVLLVLLVGGGLYGTWQYVQGQYYVGVQDGNVAVFRGVNQNLAGFSLSSLVQRTSLPLSQVVTSNQAMIRQTIAADSLTGAQNIVTQIQKRVNDCHSAWRALQAWQAEEVRFLSDSAAFAAKRTKVRPVGPGLQPATPDAADCAGAAAFGIPASSLPGAQPVTNPASGPATRPTGTPTAKASAKASPTSRTTG
jgi:protein phosphatase